MVFELCSGVYDHTESILPVTCKALFLSLCERIVHSLESNLVLLSYFEGFDQFRFPLFHGK
jgi:hypothetical protein